MSPVKKKYPKRFQLVDEPEAVAAIEIQFNMIKGEKNSYNWCLHYFDKIGSKDQELRILQFHKTYHHPYHEVVEKIWQWYGYIFTEERNYAAEEIYRKYAECIALINIKPMKIVTVSYSDVSKSTSVYPSLVEWVFKDFVYEIKGHYSDEEVRLLILEDFDNERRHFEKLKVKFDESETSEYNYERPRIPEKVRIEVWRRDGGKCARCGSREKLEYDHIIPISKGGSNTARNIEMLCEKHNRSKSNNIE